MITLPRIAYLALAVTLIAAQQSQATPGTVDTNSKRFDAARAEALAKQNSTDSMMAGMKTDIMEENSEDTTVDTNSKRFDSARAKALEKSKKMQGERAQLNLDAETATDMGKSELNVVDTNPKRFDAARAIAQGK